MKVAIVGATGETGNSIVNGLLESTSPKYEIVALTRAPSLQKPRVLEYKSRGVSIVPVDLEAPEEEISRILSGIDVVISALDVAGLGSQVRLADAAKAAGVKRFVPCFFGTVAPARGVMAIREQKEDVLDHIKKIRLPYTVIDVGFWFQISYPRLLSGRTDSDFNYPPALLAGDGNVKSATTDLRDIGRYVARIIADPRTLNRSVFAYSELLSQNEVFDLLEKISGEKAIERQYISEESILKNIADAQAKIATDPSAMYGLVMGQYFHSMGIRGDNTPEVARYLGYVTTAELYPDLRLTSFASFFEELLAGKVPRVYQDGRYSRK